jgi:transaldolase
MDGWKAIDHVIITNSNFQQYTWMQAEKRNFTVHQVYYSQNIKPFIYKQDPLSVDYPGYRHTNVDEVWVWGNDIGTYLQELGFKKKVNIVGPILWYLPAKQEIENQSNFDIVVFDVTPFTKEREIELGVINNYYKIYADGAELNGIIEMARNPMIKGFTTNPTLMRKAGIADYKQFALEVIRAVPDRPISFEVFSDDFEEMYDQAVEIASWGKNVNIKVPVTNTEGKFAGDLVSRLSEKGIFVNITALMTIEQVNKVMDSLRGDAPAYISVFAGRIADTGRDPMPVMAKAATVYPAKDPTQRSSGPVHVNC